MTLTPIASPQGLPGYTRTLPRVAQSAAEARVLVRAALGRWGLDELADDGALVVSELVGNAATHTAGRLIRVTVTRPEPDLVRIAVVDRSHTPPVPQHPHTTEAHGRGLLLVQALTCRWGTDLLPWGKRVWGELRRMPA